MRCLLTLTLPFVLLSPATAQDDNNKQLEKVLGRLEEFGRKHKRWNVPPDHGRFLWLMTELSNAKRVLEIGTSNGYSSIWIARGLRNTGGKLITIEYDKGRAAEAKENFKKAGIDDIVTCHADDAFKVIPTLEGQFDLIFLDAWKGGYKRLFDITIDKLKPGGVFLAHNAVAMAKDMKDFLDAIHAHPQLITNVVQMGRDGFAVGYKRKPDAKTSAAK